MLESRHHAGGHAPTLEVTCTSIQFWNTIQISTFIWAENGGSFPFSFYSKVHPLFSSDVNPVPFTCMREKKQSNFGSTFVSRTISHSVLALLRFN